MKTRKHSKKREAILAKIRSTTGHPTADWIFQELRDEYPDLSLGTVYRNLALFKEEGVIISVGNVDGQERFDGKVQPHGHFVCQQCRSVIDIDLSSDQSDLIAHLEDIQQCEVERVDFTAYGICSTCLKAKNN